MLAQQRVSLHTTSAAILCVRLLDGPKGRPCDTGVPVVGMYHTVHYKGKGFGLCPTYVDIGGRSVFVEAGAKAWMVCLTTGATRIHNMLNQSRTPTDITYTRPRCVVGSTTNTRYGVLWGPAHTSANALWRISRRGGGLPVADLGFRTGAPSCPQVAVRFLCGVTEHRQRKLEPLDCAPALLTGQDPERES